MDKSYGVIEIGSDMLPKFNTDAAKAATVFTVI